MIVLLSYSTSCYCNNHISSTGELNDSVFIAYDDLRIVNSKLIELKYEKEINQRFQNIIKNDSIIIASYNSYTNDIIHKNRRLLRQRNIAGGISILGIILSIVLLIK